MKLFIANDFGWDGIVQMTQASNASTSDRVRHTDEVPVLISGAGPVGLITSILLSRQGIRNWVVEKRDTLNTLPRARGITVRTVEILTHVGLGEELDRIALPRLWTKSFVYTEKLAGELVGIMSAIAMESGTAAQVTPAGYRVAAQNRIDPMLYNAPGQHTEASIPFRTEGTD